MSATGLEVFDRTLQTTHIWLDEISKVIGPDRKLAWRVLSAVLQQLRDRIPVELAAHLGAQLPLLVRGTFYDQFTPARQPGNESREEFLQGLRERLEGSRPVDAQLAARAVMATLSRHLPEGQVRNVRDALPKDLRALWSEAEAEPPRPPSEREEQP